jgi:hypothetical protein
LHAAAFGDNAQKADRQLRRVEVASLLNEQAESNILRALRLLAGTQETLR